MSYSERRQARNNDQYSKVIQVTASGLAAAGAAAMTFSAAQGLLASDILVNTMIYGAATAGSGIALAVLLLVFAYLVADLMATPKTEDTVLSEDPSQEVA